MFRLFTNVRIPFLAPLLLPWPGGPNQNRNRPTHEFFVCPFATTKVIVSLKKKTVQTLENEVNTPDKPTLAQES